MKDAWWYWWQGACAVTSSWANAIFRSTNQTNPKENSDYIKCELNNTPFNKMSELNEGKNFIDQDLLLVFYNLFELMNSL